MKIFDVKNQLDQVSNDIIRSEFKDHFVMEKCGLLYITDEDDFNKCIEAKKYNKIGYINSNNKTDQDIKQELKALINKYNK